MQNSLNALHTKDFAKKTLTNIIFDYEQKRQLPEMGNCYKETGINGTQPKHELRSD